MKISVILLTFFLCISAKTGYSEYIAVDGDSLENNGDRIRLQGIDAPELSQNCFDISGNEYACGLAALHYLQEKISEDNIHCKCERIKDKYGRMLCECFIGNDDISINSDMVRSGHAMSYKTETYANEEKTAKSERIGIWQGKFMRPAIFRALNRY